MAMKLDALILFGIVPFAVIIGVICARRWYIKQRRIRCSSSEKLLRPAGYTLSCQLNDLCVNLLTWLMGIVCVAILFSTKTATLQNPIFANLFLALISGVLVVLALRTIRQIENVRQGLHGEQIMGEYLQNLIAQGYKVFHDIPGDGKWNVDHVVVGPAGVFVIETKTRSKKPSRTKQPEYEVIVDGQTLRFPYYTDKKTLEQARMNAAWVDKWLSKATGEPVTAQAIVALPGWMVKQTAPAKDVWVMNVKGVPKYIASCSKQLSESAIGKIAYQLDQRCRDVQF